VIKTYMKLVAVQNANVVPVIPSGDLDFEGAEVPKKAFGSQSFTSGRPS
jgi:hypothetical protein